MINQLIALGLFPLHSTYNKRQHYNSKACSRFYLYYAMFSFLFRTLKIYLNYFQLLYSLCSQGYVVRKSVKKIQTNLYFQYFLHIIPDKAFHILGIVSTSFMRDLHPEGFS